MSYVWNTNNISGSNVNGTFLFALKQSLQSAGWLLKGCGNGVDNYDNIATNNSSECTDYVSQPTDLFNNRSWMRLRTPGRMPDGNYREITTQLVVNQYYNNAPFYPVRIKYSRCNGDSGFYGASGTGTGSFSVTPRTSTATDEYIVLGSDVGSDTGSVGSYYEAATLVGENLIIQYYGETGFDSSTHYWSTCADNTSPYPFYIFTHVKTSKYPRAVVSFFPVDSNTYNAGDLDSYIFGFCSYQGTNAFRSILGLGTANELMVSLSDNRAPLSGQDSITNNDVLLPNEYYRLSAASAPRGWKGASSFTLTTTALNSRQNLDTFNVNSTRDRILIYKDLYNAYYANILPWDGSVPLF